MPHFNIYKFLVFRHGETDWNRALRFQGHTDIPLNDLGKAQALGLRDVLNIFRPSILITSDLQRARQTAEIALGDLKVDKQSFYDLRECHLGDTEGMHRDEIEKKFGSAVLQKWRSVNPEDLNFGLPGGETKLQHQERLFKCLLGFIRANPNHQSIAVSTHGGSILRLTHACQGAPTDPLPIPNCCFVEIHYLPNQNLWSLIRASSL